MHWKKYSYFPISGYIDTISHFSLHFFLWLKPLDTPFLSFLPLKLIFWCSYYARTISLTTTSITVQVFLSVFDKTLFNLPLVCRFYDFPELIALTNELNSSFLFLQLFLPNVLILNSFECNRTWTSWLMQMQFNYNLSQKGRYLFFLLSIARQIDNCINR